MIFIGRFWPPADLLDSQQAARSRRQRCGQGVSRGVANLVERRLRTPEPHRLAKLPDRREAALVTQRLTARAYREPAITCACDADGQRPLLAKTADQRVAHEHDAQGFFLNTLWHDQVSARRWFVNAFTYSNNKQFQLIEGCQVLNHCIVAAWLTSHDAAASGFNDQPAKRGPRRPRPQRPTRAIKLVRPVWGRVLQ